MTPDCDPAAKRRFLPVVGDGSAQLLGGVVGVGDGDPVVLVQGAVLRVLQVLLHVRARVGRVQMYRYADGQMNKSLDRRMFQDL